MAALIRSTNESFTVFAIVEYSRSMLLRSAGQGREYLHDLYDRLLMLPETLFDFSARTMGQSTLVACMDWGIEI